MAFLGGTGGARHLILIVLGLMYNIRADAYQHAASMWRHAHSLRTEAFRPHERRSGCFLSFSIPSICSCPHCLLGPCFVSGWSSTLRISMPLTTSSCNSREF